MNKLNILLLFALFHFVMITDVFATTFDREYLYHFIKTQVEEQLAQPAQGKLLIEVSKIDPRITLQPCLTPLLANIPQKHNSRNVNVKIVCNDKDRWQIFVPVKIQTIVPVLVTNMRIIKGTLLDETSFETVYRDSALIRGEVIVNPTSAIGVRAKRNLSKGTIITSKNICFVCKNQPVTITAKSSQFEIKSSGIALRDGSLGDIISVKNEKSGRIIRAQVSAINQVVINL